MDDLIAEISSQTDLVGHMSRNPFVPKKLLFTKNCNFFKKGNELCKVYSKEFVTSIEDEAFLHKEIPEFPCGIKNCQKVFNTIYAHELHHWSVHCNSCSECNRQFPSNLLLQHHIEKEHDSYLKVAAEKSESVYNCLIKDCKESFHSPDDRAKHLLRVHSVFVESKKKAQTIENKMDIVEMPTCVSTKKKYVSRVPQSICFGAHSVKAFNQPKSKKNSGKHRASVNDSDITMDELADAIP